MSNILIEISGFCIRFELLNNHPFIPVLTKRYSQFVSSKTPLISISVNFKKGKSNPFKPTFKFKKNILEAKRGDFTCKLNLKTRRGFLEVTPQIQSFDSFLRTLYSWLLIQDNGILLHSAGAVINNKGYLFIGKSGAGKSTICQILQRSEVRGQKTENFPLIPLLQRGRKGDFTVLTDELMPLRIIDGKIKIYPSPFWGQLGDRVDGSGCSGSPLAGKTGCGVEEIELKKIFFLKKAKRNKLNIISRGEFYKRMLDCIMNFSKQADDARKALQTVDTLADKIQYFELEFSKNRENFTPQVRDNLVIAGTCRVKR